MNYSISCEIEDLIKEVSKLTNKSYDECELGAFASHVYPEGKKTFVAVSTTNSYSTHWFRMAVKEIMIRDNVQSMYITEAI